MIKNFITIIIMISFVFLEATPEALARIHHRRHHHYSKMKKVLGIAAPIGIGAAFGPAGSISYQVVKHRHAIKRGFSHHRRR